MKLAETVGIKKDGVLNTIHEDKSAVAKWEIFAQTAGVNPTSFSLIKQAFDDTQI